LVDNLASIDRVLLPTPTKLYSDNLAYPSSFLLFEI